MTQEGVVTAQNRGDATVTATSEGEERDRGRQRE